MHCSDRKLLGGDPRSDPSTDEDRNIEVNNRSRLGIALELEPSSTSEWKTRFQAVRIKHIHVTVLSFTNLMHDYSN